jgi:hypothetical protein
MCCVVHHKENENVDKDINGRHILCTVRIDICKLSERLVQVEGAEVKRGWS